jgi:hypothetical protein
MRVWFFKVPILKLLLIGVFFGIPLVTGYASFPDGSPAGIGAYVGSVAKYWAQVLIETLKSLARM